MRAIIPYDRWETKLLLIAPLILILFSTSVFLISRLDGGEWMKLGIDLEGGTSVTIYDSNVSAEDIKSHLESEYEDVEVTIRSDFEDEIQLEVGLEVNSSTLKNDLEIYTGGEVETKEIGPTLGAAFQSQAKLAIAVALILMTIVVFVRFLDPVPSSSIILSAVLDMFFALAMMRILGIRLNLHTIAALLMIIGYSVDSNILLTTKIFKRKGDLYDKMKSSFETGILMSVTTIVAISTLFIFSTSAVISEISAVLIFGLLADFVNTWFLNAGILRWYVNTGKARVVE